jgi:hypothetical protein
MMTFPKLTKEEMVTRLAPPSGKVRMVLDTDTYNEVDDQFALSYALMSPEKLDVEAVYAAPFSGTFFAKLLNKDDVTKKLLKFLECLINLRRVKYSAAPRNIWKTQISLLKATQRAI